MKPRDQLPQSYSDAWLVKPNLKKIYSEDRKWRKLDEYPVHCLNSVLMTVDIWNPLQRNRFSVQLCKQENEESIIEMWKYIFLKSVLNYIQGGPKVGIQYTVYSIVLMVLLRY